MLFPITAGVFIAKDMRKQDPAETLDSNGWYL